MEQWNTHNNKHGISFRGKFTNVFILHNLQLHKDVIKLLTRKSVKQQIVVNQNISETTNQLNSRIDCVLFDSMKINNLLFQTKI